MASSFHLIINAKLKRSGLRKEVSDEIVGKFIQYIIFKTILYTFQSYAYKKRRLFLVATVQRISIISQEEDDDAA